MSKKLMAAMMTSISEVMETMFFIPVDTDDDHGTERPDFSDQPHACRLAFKGELNGAVSICAPEGLLTEMTGNFMGEDPEKMTQDLLNGTLKEMLNMVCGNALRQFDAAMPFELGIPEVVCPPDLSGIKDVRTVKTPDGSMSLFLELDAV